MNGPSLLTVLRQEGPKNVVQRMASIFYWSFESHLLQTELQHVLRVSKKTGWSNEKQILVNYSSSSSALKSGKAKEMQKEVTKEEADKIGEEKKVSSVPAKPEEKKL
ncbi:hypothetical protein DY000_02043602 [Brassica cretica]|uniref:Uncharacterized protein n=1 Tax=Brassica cretica TaxID=69181 RepID=A0ABQ7B8U3_BRACR|nr:hypothetical protein DY000_02043602 [Brassica cretica]